MDSSIERFVKLLHQSIERQKSESAGKLSSRCDGDDGEDENDEDDGDEDGHNDHYDGDYDEDDDDDDRLYDEDPSGCLGDNEEDRKPENNGKIDHRDFDDYCKVVEGDDLDESVHSPEVSSSGEDFEKHRKGHRLKIFYDCLKCGFSTRCYSTMTDHICKYHDNDTSLVKRKIYRITGRENNLPDHVESSSTNGQRHRIHPHQQVAISNQFHSSEQILSRNNKEHMIDSNGEKVDYEESETSDAELMANGSGSGSGRYECKICLQEFTRTERVREHYDAIHLKMVYICSLCGYTNRWKRSVIQHLRSKHEKSPPYKPLMIKKRVENHDHPPSTSGSAASLDRSHSNGTKSFASGSVSHIKNTHSCEPPLDDILNRKKLISSSSITHIRQHQSPSTNFIPRLNLPSTSSGITRKPPLNPLNLKVTPNDKKKQDGAKDGKINLKECYLKLSDDLYQCTECAKTCGSSQGITEHYEAFHLNMAFICQLCGFTDIWRSMMTKHLRQKHQLSKPYDEYLKRVKLDPSAWQPFSHRHSASTEPSPHKRRSVSSIGVLHNGLENNISSQGNHSTPNDEKIQSKASLKSTSKDQANVDNRSDLLRVTSTNLLRNFQRLKPPFDQLLLRRAEPTSSNLLGLGEKTSLALGDEEDDDDIFSDAIEQPTGAITDFNPSSPNCLGNIAHYSLLKPSAIRSSISPSAAGQIYPCELCNKSFGTLRGLKEHHEGMHTDMVWACKLCPFTDKWRPQAVSHVRHNHGCGPPYNDHLIRRKLTNSSTLTHIRPHQASATDFMPQLSLPSTSSGITRTPPSDALNLKVSSADKKKQDNAKESKTNLKECYLKLSDDQYQCTKCTKTCGSSQGITEHYEAFHLNMAYLCQLCGFTDIWRSMMTKHLRQKHQLNKPYDEYLERVQLDPSTRQPFNHSHPIPKEQSHQIRPKASNETSHNGSENNTPSKDLGKQYFHQDNQLKCKLCGSSFTSLQGFHEHYEAIHLDVIWTCRECSISFRWRQQLTKHLKLIHKCNPPFNEYMLKETGSHKLKDLFRTDLTQLLQ